MGHYSVAGEDVYEYPFLWGSKRTGPDLARVGGRYSDEWHRIHLIDPRSVVPVSNMPGYPWLFKRVLTGEDTSAKMSALSLLGVPYDPAEIADAKASVEGVSEGDALIAYPADAWQGHGQLQGGAGMTLPIAGLLLVTISALGLSLWIFLAAATNHTSKIWPNLRSTMNSR